MSPKNSSISELFPEEGQGEEEEEEEYASRTKTGSAYIYRESGRIHARKSEDNDLQQHSATTGATHSSSTSKRPSSLNLSAMDASATLREDAFSFEDDAESGRIYTLDDLADNIVEVSTDDDSSSEEESDDDEYTNGSGKHLRPANIQNKTNESTSMSPSQKNSGLGSKNSSDSSLRRKHSGSNSPSPIRKNSSNWRDSSMLSPAVARVSTDIFPKNVAEAQAAAGGINRLRNAAKKIRIGVRVGRSVQKAQDLHGMKRINQYLIIRALGEGSYGKVKLAEDVNTGKQYAMKVLRKTSPAKRKRRMSIHSATDMVAEEIAIMKKLNHPNVVKLYEVLETPTTVYLFIEFYPQGPVIDLENEMQAQENVTGEVPTYTKLATQTVRRYVRDIVKGLSYLHAHGVIHQDLKPNNLLLGKDGTVAISDFGISTLISSKSDLVHITNNGTPAFMAPELHGAQSAAHSGQVRLSFSPLLSLFLSFPQTFFVFSLAPLDLLSLLCVLHVFLSDPNHLFVLYCCCCCCCC